VAPASPRGRDGAGALFSIEPRDEHDAAPDAQTGAQSASGMSQRADELFEEAQALPDEERAILVLQLLDSVGEPEIERAWRDEVRRRLEDVDAGRATLAPWHEARRRIFARKQGMPAAGSAQP
jgi:putative addiction module component (TIGR02574 family)